MLVTTQVALFLTTFLTSITAINAIQVEDLHTVGINIPETEEGLLLVHYEEIPTVINGTDNSAILA